MNMIFIYIYFIYIYAIFNYYVRSEHFPVMIYIAMLQLYNIRINSKLTLSM